MYKIAQVVRFRDDLDLDDAQRRWNGPHAELGKAVPGIRRYTQNYAYAALHLVGIDPDRRPAFDGYAFAWFDDEDAYLAAARTDEWAAVSADGDELFDPNFDTSVNGVEERLIVEGPEGPLKTVWFGRFHDDVRPLAERTAERSRYWTETHGLVYGVKVPGIGKYLQNHVIEPDPSRRPEYDGISECWFADMAAYDEMNAAPQWDAMNEDALTVFDRDWIVTGWSAALHEHRVV